jgi:phospholipase C
MAYYTGKELPFYHSLASTFPVCDRYFCSVLAQTYPNRRFLLAGTAFGLIATDTSSISGIPPNGTIFDRLDAHDISWASYASNVSTLYVIADIVQKNPGRIKTIDQFYTDAKSGSLPAVSYVDPNILTATEENPQDISLGENFVSMVVNALLNSPAWHKTLLVWTYDEHGGYYDHVPPPPAIPPDDIAPVLTAANVPGKYDRYGFRVPTVVMSAYSKPHYVSHTVYDHTSVLKTIERKWNLPAMTYRDANANDLLDCLDLRHRAFADPPTLGAPGNPTGVSQTPEPPAGEQPPFSAFVKKPAVTA